MKRRNELNGCEMGKTLAPLAAGFWKAVGFRCPNIVQFFFKSVSTATRYWLDGPGNESRWGARFSEPFQTDPGAQPVSYILGTGYFPDRGVALTTHPHLAPRLKKRAITVLSLWAFVDCSRATFTFLPIIHCRIYKIKPWCSWEMSLFFSKLTRNLW